MTSVKTNDNGFPVGKIQCILCSSATDNAQSKKSEFTVQSKTRKGSWITSNFKKHITWHQKKNKENSEAENVEQNRHSQTIGMVIIPVHEENPNSEEYLSDNDNIEYVSNAIDHSQSPGSDEHHNTNKNQSLHSTMYYQISSQLLHMEVYIQAEGNTEKQADMVFTFENKSISIKIIPIEPDGICLFSSICHQLNCMNFENPEKMISANQLRAKVVVFLEENFEVCKRSLKSRAYDEQMIQRTTDEEKPDMVEQCKQIISELKNPIKWGGCETLMAVSLMYNVNILIIKENSDHGFGCSFDGEKERTLIIANRFRIRHYDSVIFIDQNENDIYNITQSTVEKMQNAILNQNQVLYIY